MGHLGNQVKTSTKVANHLTPVDAAGVALLGPGRAASAVAAHAWARVAAPTHLRAAAPANSNTISPPVAALPAGASSGVGPAQIGNVTVASDTASRNTRWPRRASRHRRSFRLAS